MAGEYNSNPLANEEFRTMIRPHSHRYKWRRSEEPVDAIKTLLDRQPASSMPSLPPELRELYGGDLHFPATDRPYVIANFATTLDGVVSYKIPGKSGGGEITGHNANDQFIMAVLRASADAVMVGSRTFEEVSPSHLWIPEYVYPGAAGLFQSYRATRSEHPLITIVSGRGRLDVTRAIFHTPSIQTLIVTTPEGKRRIDAACADARCSVQTRAVGTDSSPIAPEAIINLLHQQFDVRLLLNEGGPTLFGQFIKANLIDELFLTIAPQMAGRNATADRPALIRNLAFLPADAPWLKLLSVKNGRDHLFLRYGKTKY